jgi:rod shape-determining protein MreC
VRVGPFTSTVLLLTDPGFTVGARLDRQGTVGLATATATGLEFALVEGGRLQEGDALLTTGLRHLRARACPVGRVTSVDDGRLVSTAQVEPFVDVRALDLVGVVTEPPRSTPRVPLEPSPRP